MIQKELLEEFKSARWKTSDEMRAFVRKVEGFRSDDIVNMLDIVMSRKSMDSPEHGMRVRALAELAANVTDKALFEPYLRALKSEDRHIRSVMVNLFPNAVNPPLLPKLCELLRSSDVNLRRVTSQILQKIAVGDVVRILGEMFAERGFAGRNEAIDIASASISHYSVEFFKVVLETGTSAEKIRVLKFLSNPAFVKNHPKSIASTARFALLDSEEAVLLEGISLFSKVCSEEDFFNYVGTFLYDKNLKLVKTTVEGLRYFSSDRAAAALERKLFTGPNEIRMAVLDSIEYNGTEYIQKPLIKALQHRQIEVKERAFGVLKNLAEADKLDLSLAVLWMLRSSDPNVRKKTLVVLASMPEKTKNLWQEILEHLRRESWWIKQQLLEPLSEMAGRELTPHLLKYLSDPTDMMCYFALDMLERLNAPEALEALVAVVEKGEEWWVREKAIYVIAGLKDQGTTAFLLSIAAREPDFRVAVIDALNKMGSFTDARQVLSFLADDNPDVRKAALKFAVSMNNPEDAPLILPLVQDKDVRVRRLAASTLDNWHIDYSENATKGKKTLSLLDRLLTGLHEFGGDDLILLPDNPPYMKKHGETMPMSKSVLTLQHLQAMLIPVLPENQQEDLRNLIDADLSYEVQTENLRFRANVFSTHTGISGVFRVIKANVWKLEELGLPPIVGTFGGFKNGLVLVGGPTGSGKSATLASIISDIIRTSRRHVISIEDPIEVVHNAELGLVNQREVGVHTRTFDQALRMTLREDPDVILVGEMRDLPTIQFAVTAAETGHLVFGTVHTVSADSSVDRLINAYPPEAQEQVRAMLADSLRAVLCQYLIKHKDKPEMVLATELMINNSAISNLIRKGKTFQIPSVITTSKEQHMQLMDGSLMDLYKAGKISAESAYLKASSKAEFEALIGIAQSPAPTAGPAKAPEGANVQRTNR